MSEPGNSPVVGTAGVSPRLKRLLYFAVALFLAHQVFYLSIYKPMTIFGVDYGKHWKAAVAVLEGRSVYTGLPLGDPRKDVSLYDSELWMGFNYPQWTAFTFVWLGFFTQAVAEKVWKLFLLACVAACWLLAWRALRPADIDESLLGPEDRAVRAGVRSHWWLTTVVVTMAFMPAVSALYIGNIDPYNALLAVAMIAALAGGRPRLAGAIWAMLTLVKLLPVALVVPVFFWRRWKVLAGFAGVMVFYLLLLAVTGRLGQEWFLYHDMLPLVPYYWRGISFTPVRAVLDLTGYGELWHVQKYFEVIVRAQGIVFGAAYVAFLYWFRKRGADWMRGLEVAILLYVIVTPLLEYHHFVYVMPVIYLQLRRWAEGRMNWTAAGGLLFGWILLQIGFIVSFQLSNIKHIHFVSTLAYFVIVGFTLYDALKHLPNRPIQA
ncbi:MAG: glycosyltransferase family 87 protein [Candidatus Sumerlaeia bacterium]